MEAQVLNFHVSAYLSYGHNTLVVGNVIVICDFCSEPWKSSLLYVTEHRARLFMHHFLKL